MLKLKRKSSNWKQQKITSSISTRKCRISTPEQLHRTYVEKRCGEKIWSSNICMYVCTIYIPIFIKLKLFKYRYLHCTLSNVHPIQCEKLLYDNDFAETTLADFASIKNISAVYSPLFCQILSPSGGNLKGYKVIYLTVYKFKFSYVLLFHICPPVTTTSIGGSSGGRRRIRYARQTKNAKEVVVLWRNFLLNENHCFFQHVIGV